MTLIALAFNIVYIRVDVAENKRGSYLIMSVGHIGKQLYWVIVAHFLSIHVPLLTTIYVK